MAKSPPKLKELKAERDRTVKELRATERDLRRAQSQRAEVMAMQLGYKAAEASRVRKDYRKNLGSADALMGREREKVMQFSRGLFLASGVYRSFVVQSVNLIIGTGLVPVGKGSGSKADAVVKKFLAWADAFCDARGMEGFGDFQRLFAMAALVDGDIGSAFVESDGRDGVQVIESDMIANPGGARLQGGYRGGYGKKTDAAEASNIVDGVELGPLGEIRALHVAEYDPSGNTVKLSKVQRVPAELVIFIALRDRHSQTRGIPYLASALDRLAGLDETLDAVEVATKVHASLGVVVESQTPATMRSLVETGTESGSGGDGESGSRETSLMRQEPGSWWFLNPGEKISTVQGSQPNSTFDAYAKMLLRLAAAPSGMPVEIAMGDFSDSNFSVSRMAEMFAQNSGKPLRGMIQRKLCQRIYTHWLARSVLRGELSVQDAEAGAEVQWRAPKRSWIDPEKEVRAAVDAINNNLSTWRDELAKLGEDWEEIFAQKAIEMERMKALGIEPVMLPGAKTAGTDAAGSTDNTSDRKKNNKGKDAGTSGG